MSVRVSPVLCDRGTRIELNLFLDHIRTHRTQVYLPDGLHAYRFIDQFQALSKLSHKNKYILKTHEDGSITLQMKTAAYHMQAIN